MNKTIVVIFNDEISQEQVDLVDDRICELLHDLDITAVTQVGEQEVCDEQA